MSILRIFNNSLIICAQEKIFILQNDEISRVIDISIFFNTKDTPIKDNIKYFCQEINEIKVFLNVVFYI